MSFELKKYKNFCPVPWTQFASTTDGLQRTCCTMSFTRNELLDLGYSSEELDKHQDLEDGYFIFKDGKKLKVSDGIDRYINSDSTKNIKKLFSNNKAPLQCRCYVTEKISTNFDHSRRQRYLSEYKLNNDEDVEKFLQVKNHSIDYYDIRLGNVCNLQCLMCAPGLSNQLYESEIYRSGGDAINVEGKLQVEKINGKLVYDKELEKKIFDWANDDFFKTLEVRVVDDLNLNKDKIITFYMIGGEPLLNAPHFRFLERMVELGYSKNIVLEYNTNLTILTDYIINLWTKFKKIILAISIDSTGDQYEYIRYPSKWSKIQSNLSIVSTMINEHKDIFDQSVNVVSVVNLLTAFNFSQLEKSVQSYGINAYKILSTGPSHTTPVILTPDEKLEYIKLINNDSHYNELVDYVNSFSYDSTARQRFDHMLQYWNSTRRLPFNVVFPELSKILKI